METWNQIYNPMDSMWLSTFVAALPIMLFIALLTLYNIKGYISGLISVLFAGFISVFVYKFPVKMFLSSAMYGMLSGVWPVASIVLSVIILYKITVKTGYFDVIKGSITSITGDQRIQVLIIAFSFGAFLEGTAGYGAPIAITCSILVGLGFSPIYAAGLCLIANLASGVYGSMGIPVTAPAGLTNLNPLLVSQYTSNIMPIIALLIAFLLVFIIDGIRGVRQTLPAILTCGLTFGIVQYIISTFLGAELVDIFASVSSIIALMILLRFWKPKETFRINKEDKVIETLIPHYSARKIFFAWLPYIILTVFVTIMNLHVIKEALQPGGLLYKTVLYFKIPNLHQEVIREAPIVKIPTPFDAMYKLDLLTSTTSAIILTIFISMLLFKANGKIFRASLIETFKELWSPILTICSVLALAYVCTYSGLSSTIGLALSNTGQIFPFLAPVLGWLGVFLTGFVVSSGTLLAPLQSVTATQIGLDPASLVAMNVIGGDIAKMLSPQSIAIATAAVGLAGRDSDLFKFTISYSGIFLIIVGVCSIIMSQI
ncbi:L-lactate permease [Bacillus sp. 03113]|uniref:L-lactate permease n=1 Tax=Bacillus sp. 03113 TaxID=2578211 RepID=UPI001144CC4C|nr:lactate permease LctP family transporter [Bacillus sp. 03113]